MTRVLFALLLAFIVVAWAVAAHGVIWARPPQSMRVGSNIWIGYEPLHAAQSRGHLSPRIEMVELVTATQVMRAFRYGEIDAALVTLDEAIRLTRGHGDVVVVGVADISAGGDAVVARADIVDLAGLKGKRIGVEETSVGGYLLGRALALGGLTRDDIMEVHLVQAEQRHAWQAGAVDAVVTFEPVLSQLTTLGARTLLTSRELPGEIVDVLVARRGMPADDVGVLREAWFAARDEALVDPDAFAKASANRLGITATEVKASMNLVVFPTRPETDALIRDQLLGRARALAAELRRAGIDDVTDADVSSLFEGASW